MVGSGPEEFSVEVPGGRLAGLVRGAGRELLLLHGGPGLPVTYLDPLVEELGDYRVATYQQRGLPPSTARQPYDVPQQAADVVAVLDALGWDRALLLGHSWGGHLLLHVVAQYPDRIAGALVVDAVGAVGDGGDAEFRAAVAGWTPSRAKARLKEIDRREQDGPLTPDELAELWRLVWPAYFADPASAPPAPAIAVAPEAFSATMESVVAELPHLASRLRASAVPVRFVHGRQSPIPTTASIETADLLRAPVDLLDGCGHFAWLEAPGAVVSSLRRLEAAEHGTEYLLPRPSGLPVHLAEPDPTWPAQYAAQAALIRGALGDRVLVLEHAGSTSVPGLAAKPVLDIVLAVADPADEAAYVPALEDVGFVLHLRERDWHQHRLLRRADPLVNLHVFGPGSAEIERMLTFRDRLRAYPEERERYEARKRELAARTWAYVQDYADAKSDVVQAIIARARATE